MFRFYCVLFIFLGISSVLEAASVNYGAHLGARSYVRGSSAELYASYERLLWGDRKSDNDIQFGVFQLKAAVATHGMIKASVSVFPISFLEIKAEQSKTYRYSSPATLSCDGLQCYGPIDRQNLQARLALGWQNWVGLISRSAQNSRSENTGELSFDEIENLKMNSGEDDGEGRAAFIGLKLNDLNRSVVGAAIREFEYKKSPNSNRIVGFAYHTHAVIYGYDLKVSALVGSYKSDWNPESISAAAAIEYNWGDEKLSIF